jgi:hypothetical protein
MQNFGEGVQGHSGTPISAVIRSAQIGTAWYNNHMDNVACVAKFTFNITDIV